MEKNIVHFDLDAFYVSVERLKNPLLLNKPVIVGGISDRGVVAACSYEARKFGIHSAMSSVMAKRLCPDAIFIKGDYESYTQYSDMVTQIISDRVPVLEKTSIDEFYVDLSGMEKYFGCLKYSTQIKNEICKETGLTISFGLASNKTVSKVATNEVKPNGQCHILAGNEKAFLRPLSVSKLPMVGSVTGQTLRNMGIQNIGSLAEMPRKMLESVFGKNGTTLWERANGLDNTPIEPYHDKKSISKEITFDKDTTDVNKLKAVLLKMVEEMTFELRQKQQCTCCVTVKIRYSNFDTHTKQFNIPYTTDDQTIIDKVTELFEKLYDKRLLIRLIGVRFSKLVQGFSQINLFDNTAEMAGLYQAMDRVRIKYGSRLIGRAFGMVLYSTRRPRFIRKSNYPSNKTPLYH